MGQKNRAKQIMIDANVPVLLGYNGSDQTNSILLHEAKKIGIFLIRQLTIKLQKLGLSFNKNKTLLIFLGFPVMIKPVYGGGGKGMRIALNENNFTESLEAARSESNKSFGNSEMIIEKYIENPRHVEVQVIL